MNLRDFPRECVDPLGIEVLHPDTFIVAQWDLDPFVAAEAFKEMRARRKRPECSAMEFADSMERAGLPATAQRLRDAAGVL